MTPHAADEQDPIARGEPLREAVYLRIVELISSGKYTPGAALTEASLSRTLQVSRTPVREALLRLQAEGVLQSTLARGFTVRHLLHRDAAELYPILAALEGLAMRTIPSVDEATLGTLRTTLTELKNCVDPVRRWQLDSHWHATITTTAGNQQLLGMINQLRTNLSRYELAYMREVQSRTDADKQHEEILAAMTAGELERGAELLEQHWHDGMHLILNWLNSQDTGQQATVHKPV